MTKLFLAVIVVAIAYMLFRVHWMLGCVAMLWLMLYRSEARERTGNTVRRLPEGLY